MKFTIKFQRDFEVAIEADTIDIAQGVARGVVAQHPAGTCKLLSILPEGYAEASEPTKPFTPPRNRPLGGGSPGTPTIRVPVLVDQIAKVA